MRNFGFSFENSIEVTRHLSKCFPKSWDDAVVEASNRSSRSFIYVPCHPDFSASSFIMLLKDPAHWLITGPAFQVRSMVMGRPIYTAWSEALDGKAKEQYEEMTVARPHSSFLVVDVTHQLIVDYVDRDGKSLLPTAYLDSIRHDTGFTIGWDPSEYIA